jgi:uncharacterized membrane protein
MANYRKRLESDLDRWIAAGWVSAERRGDILGSVPERRIEAAAALGFAGAALLGIAVISFIMANWDLLPRFARLGLILALLTAAIGGAIWAGDRRPGVQSGLALLASLIFAAGVGLVGQMYNLPGAPWIAFAMAAFGALALCWASGRAAPGGVAAFFAALAHLSSSEDLFERAGAATIGDGVFLAFIALMILTARQQRAALLRHALLILSGYGVGVLLARLAPHVEAFSDYRWPALVFAAFWAGIGAWAWRTRWAAARTVIGYSAWYTLMGLSVASLNQLPFSIVLLVASIAGLAWARGERLGWVSGAAIVGLVVSVLMLLFNLGVDLMTIAGLFFFLAIPALIGAAVLSRRRKQNPAVAP